MALQVTRSLEERIWSFSCIKPCCILHRRRIRSLSALRKEPFLHKEKEPCRHKKEPFSIKEGALPA